ncbi:hypothetical protein Y023_2113 [Burkholderia pseudomallei A79D]|nr:hypothetical protein DO70_3990 [Burkholderia pseudomallei]KGS22606.1 hypothetical protein X962_5243 [Burkholderia pseudomallei MSHR7343]KGS61200.1 hypothetical protein X990_5467 [Burkholderia pseudomallei MSHR4868]KGS75248.1 hypothetical protein X976_3154 [Burkholderia pseudomallei MSHR7500]KGW94937.1 hypothetical protein Y048_5275 [Burkholderia pseudomallei MSHR456]KGW96342.1 hypothetical protein Y030_5492 [Burkholderia pseudomallei MSHR332]KGX49561.1 hypothetical protein Y025_5606 [Burkh
MGAESSPRKTSFLHNIYARNFKSFLRNSCESPAGRTTIAINRCHTIGERSAFARLSCCVFRCPFS